MNDEVDRPQFSVYRFFADGTYEAAARWIDAEMAVRIAKAIIEGRYAVGFSGAGFGKDRPAERVIITDGLDCLCWEWKRGEGITDLTGAP